MPVARPDDSDAPGAGVAHAPAFPGRAVPAHPVAAGEYDPVRRSLVAGDVLVSVSDGGVQTSDIGTLAPRGWLPFD